MISFFIFKLKPKIFGLVTKIIFFNKSISIGKNFKCDSIPSIYIVENSKLIISDNVYFRRNVEIRVHKNSIIQINRNIRIDRGTRLLSTNNSKLHIGNNSKIGPYCIFNGGDNIFIGKDCLVSGFVYLQTSSKIYKKGTPISHQGYRHGCITIGNDVWLGAHATILPDCKIGDGVIIGSNTVVKKSINPNEIHFGVPAKKIKERS
tara:strand:- start:55 stop:669 length:615 start_codon:yes stop_codon:yes gene_type:complete